MIVVEEVLRNPRCRLGRYGKLVVAVFHNTGTVEDFEARVALQRKTVAEHKTHVMLTVITAMSKPPAAEVRTKAAALAQSDPELAQGSVLVVTARGLGAVLLRSFLAGLTLMLPGSFPLSVARSIEAGLELRSAQLGLSPREMKELAEAVRAFCGESEPAIAAGTR
jgi:hypothetical protein